MALGVRIENDVNTGLGYANAAIDSAKAGLKEAQARGNAIRGDAQQMRNQAALINQQANAVNDMANSARAKFDNLSPYASLLSGYGNDLWNEGVNISAGAKDAFGQGGALINMDPNAGGIAGEYIKYWNSLAPDRYVSQAASDTQSAYQNAQGQMDRSMARRGVSGKSGASAELQKQYATSLATALAAAKTRARQVGLDQQAAQLDKMTSAANVLYNMGNQAEAGALAAKGKALDAQNSAAGILGEQAKGYLSVGGLQVNVGDMFGKAAGVYGDAAGIENQYLNTLLKAYGDIKDANLGAANYTLGAASTMARASGGGVVVGSSGNNDKKWAKSDSFRDGNRWTTVWTNTDTGAQVTGDALFNPNNPG